MTRQKLTTPIIGLSPMAGVTDYAFRKICREMGANYLVTEFISVSSLYYNSKTTDDEGKPLSKGQLDHQAKTIKKSLQLATFSEDQKPIFIQVFGRDPEHFRVATKILTGQQPLPDGTFLTPPSGIDINFGCPAKKVVKNACGCALYAEPEVARAVVQAVLGSTNLPVSFKTRIGYQDISALEFLSHLQDLEYHHITMHARTYEQQHRGETNNQLCKEVFDYIKQNFNRQVIFNGGIKDVASYKKAMQETGADGVLVGQAAMGNPWIFKSLQQGFDYIPTLQERKEVVLKHAKYTLEDKPEHGLIEFRKHLAWYLTGFENAKQMRKDMMKAETLEDIEKVFENWFL